MKPFRQVIGILLGICMFLLISQGLSATSNPLRLYEESWAVVIGIDQYQHWPPLQAAVRDASALAERLRSLGFDHVTLLINETATRKDILTEIGTKLAKMVGPNDRVLVYFAGHGFTEDLPREGQVGYIIPVDCPKSNFFAEAISMQQIRDTFARLNGKHIYYIMDCCFSGHGFTRAAGISPEIKDYLAAITERRAVQMITAGRKGDLAHEQGKHGIFTLYLLRGLEGEADLNGDGVVTASELGAYVQPHVFEASNQKQMPQYGRLEGEGEVIFKIKESTVPKQAQAPDVQNLAAEVARLQDMVKSLEEKSRSTLPAVGTKQIPLWTVEIFNVDDVAKVSLNGQELAQIGYKNSRQLVLNDKLHVGHNTLLIEFTNFFSGWTYGYKIRKDGVIIMSESCGDVGVMGCQDDEIGLVHSRTLDIVIDN